MPTVGGWGGGGISAKQGHDGRLLVVFCYFSFHWSHILRAGKLLNDAFPSCGKVSTVGTPTFVYW